MDEAGEEDRDAGLPDDAGLDEALALHRESLLVLLGDGHHRAAFVPQFPKDLRRHDSSGSCSYSCSPSVLALGYFLPPLPPSNAESQLPGEVSHPQSLHEGLKVLALGQLELSGNLTLNI